jgi:mono/diheme cytochrome c family protein
MKPTTARRCEMRDGTLGFRSGMQKAVQLGIGLAVVANTVAIFVALAPLPAKGEEVLSPAAQRGLVIVRANCSRCHAVGKVGDSPLPIAPPFRMLHERYPVEDLQNRLPKVSSPAIRPCLNFASIRVKWATSSRI